MTQKVRQYPRATLWFSLCGYLMLMVEVVVK